MHDRWYEKATARCFGWLEYRYRFVLDRCRNRPLEAGARTQEAERPQSGLGKPQEAEVRPQEASKG